MSLLLDALRKSERQRKLGKAPDIDVPVMPAREAHISRWRWPLLMIGLVVFAFAAWWVFENMRQDDQSDRRAAASNAASDEVDASEQAVTAASEPVSAGTDQAAAELSPEPAPDMPFKVPPARTLAAPGSTSAEPQTDPGQGGAISRELPTAMDTAPQQPMSADDLERLARHSAQPAPDQPDDNTEIDSGAAMTSATDPENSDLASEAKDPPPVDKSQEWRPAAPSPISYYELPVAVRQELEDFRVTIRIYNDDPKQRFAVINQQRFFEGDEVGEGLRLVEVRRDGVVFEYDQYRFLLP